MYKGALTSFMVLAVVAGLAIKRDSTLYKNPDGGNTVVGLADAQVNWGKAPPWTVLDTLKDHCSVTSCDESWDVPTAFVSSREKVDGHITVKVLTATYQEPAKNGLVEVIKAASANSYTKNSTDYVTNPCYTPSCETVPLKTATMDQYYAPQRISLRAEAKDGSVIHAITVEVTITVDDELAGACDEILKSIVGVGGALAGAVSGWLGAGFALASLACIA